MIGRLVLRHLALHPIRSLVFVGAYAAGVSVMLVLLSIGEVMVAQSGDEQWIGGGDVTVVPAGIDIETLRTGGAAFFGIDQARFLAREVLGGPRLANRVEAVAPWIDDRAVYLRRPDADAAVAVRASGQIPSAAQALGADRGHGGKLDRQSGRGALAAADVAPAVRRARSLPPSPRASARR